MSLNILEKLTDKNWKVRVETYDLLLSELKFRDERDNTDLNNYLTVIKTVILENNVTAQEKALNVVDYFFRTTNIANKIVTDICPVIISKYFNNIKPRVKEKGFEILKLCIELEKQDFVLDELIKGLSHKTPKVVSCSINLIKEIIHEFGADIFKMKELFKSIPKLLEDRDKTVRDAGKELILELFIWFGKHKLESILNQLKSIHVNELTKDFNNAPTKPAPIRAFRSQKPVLCANKCSLNESIIGEVDMFDNFEPVEVLKMIPNDFYNKINAKMWTERKEALDCIEEFTNNPKLIDGDYLTLVQSLLKIISSDSNIILVIKSATILCQIARGLKKGFSPYSLATIQACLEKFKVSKSNLVTCLRACADCAFLSTSFENIFNILLDNLKHKTPNVRIETSLFVSRIFKIIPDNSVGNKNSQKGLKIVLKSLVKLSEDASVSVRDAVYEALGISMFRWYNSYSFCSGLLNDMDELRLNKVKKVCDKHKESLSLPQVLERDTKSKKSNSKNAKEDTINTPVKNNRKKVELDNNVIGLNMSHDMVDLDSNQRYHGTRSAFQTITRVFGDIKQNTPIVSRKRKHCEVMTKNDTSDMDLDDSEINGNSDKYQNKENINNDENDLSNSKDVLSEEKSCIQNSNPIDMDAPLILEYNTVKSSICEDELNIAKSYLWNVQYQKQEHVIYKLRTLIKSDQYISNIIQIKSSCLDVSMFYLNKLLDQFDSQNNGQDEPLLQLTKYYNFIMSVICDQLMNLVNNFSTDYFDICETLLTNLMYLLNNMLNTQQGEKLETPYYLCCLTVLYLVSSNEKIKCLLSSNMKLKGQIHTISVIIYHIITKHHTCIVDESLLLELIAGIKMPEVLRTTLVTDDCAKTMIWDLYDKCIKFY